ncbi:hypothetical protein HPB47_010462 [Ixodes persulcatus]|uniref:Uncharacterized protein n=1 Tax=Ixodes persulcatus TaxID=34615 RepID=A0AC60NZ21_IXOPE|nr:hypothetical protein HPB47_010462 [Ixodes persulcatus]
MAVRGFPVSGEKSILVVEPSPGPRSESLAPLPWGELSRLGSSTCHVRQRIQTGLWADLARRPPPHQVKAGTVGCPRDP